VVWLDEKGLVLEICSRNVELKVASAKRMNIQLELGFN